MAQADLLPISALQHLLFCERQAALIHVERLWAENRLTVEGGQLHRKAHEGPPSRREDVRTERGLPLVSHRLGLTGVADVVEFRQGDPPLPIEYKRGRSKTHDADRVQLCAQALCLEEMLDLDPGRIAAAELFYGRTRRREKVPLDDELRSKTENAVRRLHQMIRDRETPIASRQPKCDRCSMLNLCLPDALGPRRTVQRYLDRLVPLALREPPSHEVDP